jgi:hypothetical protein
VFTMSVVVYYVFGRVCGCPSRIRVNIGLSQFKVVGHSSQYVYEEVRYNVHTCVHMKHGIDQNENRCHYLNP